jgi:hypothetical protein
LPNGPNLAIASFDHEQLSHTCVRIGQSSVINPPYDATARIGETAGSVTHNAFWKSAKCLPQNAGSGIDIWYGAGPPAYSSKRLRSVIVLVSDTPAATPTAPPCRHRKRIPCGQSDSDLKDDLGCSTGRSACGTVSTVVGGKKWTSGAKGSNFDRMTAKPCHETGMKIGDSSKYRSELTEDSRLATLDRWRSST